MAEISSVGEPILPVPPGRSPLAVDERASAVGAPVVDVPPLVEPIVVGFDDPPAEIVRPGVNGRPMRRHFLPPVAQPAAEQGTSSVVREVRSRAMSHQPAPLSRAASDRSGRRERETLPRRPRWLGVTARPAPRRGLRLALVVAGVASALAVATALEVGVGVESLARLPEAVFYRLHAPPAASTPPADTAGRLAYYKARARGGDAAAQVALAVLYAKGEEGVQQDYVAAASWFRRAAEQGVARAQYDLGVLYERGRGVPIDYAQAAQWYRKAAQQNHPLAQYNLAVAYTKGEGVGHNLSDAAVWYHRAAAQGVVAAMVNLAILYERGDGVDASAADAYAWYRAASQRGSAPAARRADELLRGFSPWEQTRAEAKMTDVAASIHDAAGERSRLAGRAAEPRAAEPRATEPGATESVASARSEPLLKSGIDGGRATTSEAAGDSP